MTVHDRPHRRESSRALYDALAIAALVVSGLGMLSLMFRHGDRLFAFPFTEDGYLSLTVARNVALGHGMTADGREYTNGVQPLWVFLSSLWFWLSSADRALGVRSVIAASTALLLVSAHVFARCCQRLWPTPAIYGVIVVVFVTSHQLCMQYFNGLETGLLIGLYALVAYVYTGPMRRVPRSVALGVLLGLLILARIDAGIFVVALLACDVIWRDRSPRALADAGLVAGLATILALPWFIYGYREFGAIMPVSGQALALRHSPPVGAWRMLTAMAGSIARNAFPSYWMGLSRPTGIAVTVAMLVLVWWSLRADGTLRRALATVPRDRARRAVVFGAALAGAMTCQAMFYLAQPSGAYFWSRYMAVLSIAGVGLMGVAIDRLTRISDRLALCALGLMAAPWIAMVGAWHGAPLAERIYTPAVAYGDEAFLKQVQLAEEYRVGAEHVGGIQSGTLGFFIDGAYNLDGKVNPAALKARQEGKLLDYMMSHVDLFVDFEGFVRPGADSYFDGAEFAKHYRRVEPASPGDANDFAVFRRIQ